MKLPLYNSSFSFIAYLLCLTAKNQFCCKQFVFNNRIVLNDNLVRTGKKIGNKGMVLRYVLSVSHKS